MKRSEISLYAVFVVEVGRDKTRGFMRVHAGTRGFARVHAGTRGYTRVHAPTCPNAQFDAFSAQMDRGSPYDEQNTPQAKTRGEDAGSGA